MKRIMILATLAVLAACSSAPIAKMQAAFSDGELVVGIVLDVTPYLATTVIGNTSVLAVAGTEITNEGVLVEIKTDKGVVIVRCAGDYLVKGTIANRCASRLTDLAKVVIERDSSGNAVAVEVD